MGSAPLLLAAISIVAATFPPCAPAADDGEADYAAARELLDQHRDAAARERLLAAGHAGHARAAATLGMMALLAPGWAGDAQPAAFAQFWLRRAASAGDPAARHLLASMDADAPRLARRGDVR